MRLAWYPHLVDECALMDSSCLVAGQTDTFQPLLHRTHQCGPNKERSAWPCLRIRARKLTCRGHSTYSRSSKAITLPTFSLRMSGGTLNVLIDLPLDSLLLDASLAWFTRSFARARACDTFNQPDLGDGCSSRQYLIVSFHKIMLLFLQSNCVVILSC